MTTSVVPPSADQRRHLAARFDAVYQQSVEQPEEFWGEAAADIDWIRPWERVLDDSRPPFYRWFAGGRLNTCYNALDRHVERGRADQLALIYDSPVTGTRRRSRTGSCGTRWHVRRGARGTGVKPATGWSSTCQWSPKQ